MLFATLISNFRIYTVTFIAVLISLTLWYYYKFIFKPYAKFPSFRLGYRIPYWYLTRQQFNYAIFQTFVAQSNQHQAEGMFVAWAGPFQPLLVVYGEDIVKKIVNEPAATDKPKFYELMEFSAGKGIFTSNGENYKKQRKMVAPALHVKAVKSYATIMNKNAEAMVKRLLSNKSRETEDIIDILSECTIRILFATNLGDEEVNPEEISQLIDVLKHNLHLLVKRIFTPWLHFDFSLHLFPSTRKGCRLYANCRQNSVQSKLEKIKASLISRRHSKHENEADLQLDDKKTKPFGDTFVEQHLQDPTITMEDIANQIAFLVGAGFDTVVHSLKFALFLLGLHQDVQDRARDEVLAETEGCVTDEALQGLNYLECVIKESLRLYPVPMFGRYVQKELQCGEYKIPRNSNVVVFSYMLHRNPEIFPDPEKFDPERFMDKDSNIKPWQYIPFAEGMRQCTGKYFAMIEMKIILAHILRNFTIISLDRWEDIEVKWSIILECTKKLRMQFVPR